MNEKLRKELVEEAEAILSYHWRNHSNVNAFAEGVLGFLKGLEPVRSAALAFREYQEALEPVVEDTEVPFNHYGTGY
jgi:hypothetical protein